MSGHHSSWSSSSYTLNNTLKMVIYSDCNKFKGVLWCLFIYDIIWCIWCNAMCLRGSRFKKHIIFHITFPHSTVHSPQYITFAPLSPAFLKRIDFYKAHQSENQGVLWLASYPVRCYWRNTSSVWWIFYFYYANKHTIYRWQIKYKITKVNKTYMTANLICVSRSVFVIVWLGVGGGSI